LFLYTAKDFGAYQKRFRGVKWYRIRPGFDLREWYVPKDQQKH
jgi:peptide/nickel transport system substrate-binding protein